MKRSIEEEADAEEREHKRARHDAGPPPAPAPAPAPLAPTTVETHLPLLIDAVGSAGQAVADAARDDFSEDDGEDEHEVVPPPPPALPLELMSRPVAASAWKAVMEDEMKELFAYPEVKVRVDRVGWTTSSATRLCNTYKCPKEAFVTALWTDKRNSDEYEALTNLDALKGDIAIKTFVVNLVESKALTNYREIQDIMRLLNDRRSAEKFLAAEFDTASGLNDDLAHWMSSQFEVFLTYSHRRKKVLRCLLPLPANPPFPAAASESRRALLSREVRPRSDSGRRLLLGQHLWYRSQLLRDATTASHALAGAGCPLWLPDARLCEPGAATSPVRGYPRLVAALQSEALPRPSCCHRCDQEGTWTQIID